MTRPISFTLFADRRSRLRRFQRLKIRLRNDFLSRRVCAVALAGDVALCRVLGAFKMYVDLRDRSISPHLMMEGIWEPRTTEVMIDLLRHGMTAIDVGANLGYFTMLMTTLCGPNGRTLAFEPNPRAAGLLGDTIALNGLHDRIDLHRSVVGAQDGQAVSLVVSPDHPGGAHVVAVADGPDVVPARTLRLDGVPGALDAALVKVDAEGMEESVWQGMTAMIAGPSLRHVILEFTAHRYADAARMLDEAEAAGFAIRCIDEEDGVVPIARAQILDGTIQRMLLFTR